MDRHDQLQAAFVRNSNLPPSSFLHILGGMICQEAPTTLPPCNLDAISYLPQSPAHFTMPTTATTLHSPPRPSMFSSLFSLKRQDDKEHQKIQNESPVSKSSLVQMHPQAVPENKLLPTVEVCGHHCAHCRINCPRTKAGFDVARQEKVWKYREKRRTRNFSKTIRYGARKQYADSRPRIKGRFVKQKLQVSIAAEDGRNHCMAQDGSSTTWFGDSSS